MVFDRTLALIISAGILATSMVLTWDWSYYSVGIVASGTFTTNHTPDISGFYQITGITGLQPTGTAIPENEPYTINNSIGPNGQLTDRGFGYSLADGTFAKTFSDNSAYFELYSAPQNSQKSELLISFSATIQDNSLAWRNPQIY
jgi:hypothetical protein